MSGVKRTFCEKSSSSYLWHFVAWYTASVHCRLPTRLSGSGMKALCEATVFSQGKQIWKCSTGPKTAQGQSLRLERCQKLGFKINVLSISGPYLFLCLTSYLSNKNYFVLILGVIKRLDAFILLKILLQILINLFSLLYILSFSSMNFAFIICFVHANGWFCLN